MTRVGFSPKPGISETEVDGKITTHAGVADAHHTPAPAPAAVGDYLEDNAADTETIDQNETPYAKHKEMIIGRGGTLRIKFDMACNNGNNGTVYGKIYRNGSPVGSEQTVVNSDPYETKSEDIAGWTRGDLLQLYGYQQVAWANGQKKRNLRCYSNNPLNCVEIS